MGGDAVRVVAAGVIKMPVQSVVDRNVISVGRSKKGVGGPISCKAASIPCCVDSSMIAMLIR